jgi:hypothetical protein
LNRHDLLLEITALGSLWGIVMAVIFSLPDVDVPTKYLYGGLWSFAMVIGATVFFGWERLSARKSFVALSIAGVFAIGILFSTGYLMDRLALSTWSWFLINGVPIVTWANLFDVGLLVVSVFVYYSGVLVSRIIFREWKEIHQEDTEKKALKSLREMLEHALQKGNQASHS